MSRSIHVTRKNFKGLTKQEIDEQASTPNSDLDKWAKKKQIKKKTIKNRKTRIINGRNNSF